MSETGCNDDGTMMKNRNETFFNNNNSKHSEKHGEKYINSNNINH